MAGSIEQILGQYSQVLSGQVVLFMYRMSQFCTKADPAALLPVEAEMKGSTVTLENMGTIELEDEYTFLFKPFKQRYLAPVAAGIKKEHPEFKTEAVDNEDEQKKKGKEKSKMLRISMPDVDPVRKEIILNGIQVLYGLCQAAFQKNMVEYNAKMGALAFKHKPEEMKKYAEQLKEVTEKYSGMRDDMFAAKKKEVEDAYEAWKAKQEEKHKKELEKAKAVGADVTKGIKLGAEVVGAAGAVVGAAGAIAGAAGAAGAAVAGAVGAAVGAAGAVAGAAADIAGAAMGAAAGAAGAAAGAVAGAAGAAVGAAGDMAGKAGDMAGKAGDIAGK